MPNKSKASARGVSVRTIVVMFIVTTPSFDMTTRQAFTMPCCMEETRREAGLLPKKQAPQRLDETLRRTTHKPIQLSQAGKPCANNKKWNSGNGMRACCTRKQS